jgi:hypothetical protein
MGKVWFRAVPLFVLAIAGFGMTLAYPSVAFGDNLFWIGLFCLFGGLFGMVYVFTETRED